MCAQSFNVALNFAKIDGFQPKFCIVDENFPTGRKFYDSFPTAPFFLAGGAIAPYPLPATMPLDLAMCVAPVRCSSLSVHSQNFNKSRNTFCIDAS